MGWRGFIWGVRVAFGLVFVVNVQCALGFVLVPGEFAAAYELSGVSGEAAVRGIGIAFLMWNATYPPFIIAPDRTRILGWVILAQQLIGLIGESLLAATLPADLADPAGHALLAASIGRFIAFDAAGLAIMGIAFALFTIRFPAGKTG